MSPQALLVALSNVGDAVLTTPVLEALHAFDPRLVIDIVADRRSAQLFEHCPYRGRIVLKDKRAGLGGVVALVRELRRVRYRYVVDLRTHVLGYLLRTDRVLAKWRSPPAGVHAVEEHCAVLQPLVGDRVPPPARIWLTERLRADARIAVGARGEERVLALGPGANWPGKIWPAARYRELAARVCADFDRIVILGNSAERELGEQVRAGITLPAVNLAGATDLLQAAAVLGGCRAFVGNDSGLGHLAAAIGTPTLVVFGPGNPVRYRPWGAHADWLGSPGAGLDDLAAATVAEGLRELLARLGA
ncbi:MAG: glycosyltransferase family 9 protein [Gammaproteobacteria bacterium]|nr:glycosyltransferase family 9 protein [Gammaproteobacteria bacterium]